MDTSILQDLGLTQAEIRAYVCLLQTGSSTAGLLLQKSGMPNSVLHRALNSLIEKGLISFIMEGKRKVYSAAEPESFYGFIEEKKRRFAQVLPQLKERQAGQRGEAGATVYKGKRGINEIYSRLLSSGGKEYRTYGGGSRVTHDAMGEDWWKNLHSRRIRMKIPARQVFDETIRAFGEELRRRPLSKVRFLSREFEQLTETVMMGGYVAIVIFTQNPYGLLIKDPQVFEGYGKTFELLWERACE